MQDPVFDVAMQGVNPAWFERAMKDVDYGIHRVEKYGEMAADSAALFRQSFEEMDAHNIRYGLLSHGVYKESFLQEQPERFMLSYEPDLSLEDHTGAARQFEEDVLSGKYAALGELGLVYEGIPLNTPDLYPYYEVAQKHGVPVLIHTGFSGPNPQQVLSPAFRIGTANPLLVEDVVMDFPDLQIVMMHMGWPFFDEGLYMLSTYPNVYMETSVAVWLLGDELFNRLLKEAVATAGSDKILFGTLQMAWPQLIGKSVQTIREAPYLSQNQKDDILWDNAVRMFEIEE
ncbi:MAG: amidohydrolase family protein [Gracilimonas sp.]|uniref:amidohydrolase family protein n=2 Tax=Gracilimonas TaxID=649462 RepID=UPI001B2BA4E7|nr:amidohydrolase family protein [Gracilimonas sp.]